MKITDSQIAGNEIVSGITSQFSGQNIEEGTFAGAVCAYDAHPVSGIDVKGDVFQNFIHAV